MAYPTTFKGVNTVYRAPEGADNVGDLEVMSNRQGLVSCWVLEGEELDEVIRTGRIYLAVMSHTLFPCFVGSESAMRDVTAEAGPLPQQSGET